MKLQAYFKRAAAIGALVLGVSGCEETIPTRAEKQAGVRVLPESCLVIDLNPGRPYAEYDRESNAYEFRNGVLLLNITDYGSMKRETSAISLKSLSPEGQARAVEMFKKIPPSANCKPPKFD